MNAPRKQKPRPAVAAPAAAPPVNPPPEAPASAPAPDTPAAPRCNARALRRVEHDGTAYGPDERCGDVLQLPRHQFDALAAIGAVCAIV